MQMWLDFPPAGIETTVLLLQAQESSAGIAAESKPGAGESWVQGAVGSARAMGTNKKQGWVSSPPHSLTNKETKQKIQSDTHASSL